MEIQIPEKVQKILDALEKKGHAAYIVGGCVRDALLNITPMDWDITTSASPEQVKSLFEKTFDTGIKHGTVTVLMEKESFEVTTFRRDGVYQNHRAPKHVSFTSSIHEDLARRDFTVNAIAYNTKEGLVDPFLGKADLENKLIRCVGDSDRRFTEDALRMLRAVRFSAQKNFEIEEKTYQSICKNKALVQYLSAERIISELTKIMLTDRLDRFEFLYHTGILEYVMPEFCRCFETEQNIKWHIYDVGRHTLKVVSCMEKKPYLRFAALMHDWGKPLTKSKNPDGSDSFRNHAKKSVLLAEQFMNRYKFSNSDKDKIVRLIQNHDREIIPEKKYVKRAVNAVGDDIFFDLLNLKRADAKGQNFSLTEPRLAVYDKIEQLYKECKENKEPFSVKNLDINGHDLITLGYSGKKIGDALQFLLNYVIEHPNENEKELLLNLLKNKEQ